MDAEINRYFFGLSIKPSSSILTTFPYLPSFYLHSMSIYAKWGENWREDKSFSEFFMIGRYAYNVLITSSDLITIIIFEQS